MSNIGQRIKAQRELRGWTQEELANKMGYKSKSTINKIELGINDVVQSKIVKFAEVLGVSIAYLMNWEDEETDLSKEIDYELATEDAELLTIFHQLSATDKERLIQMAKLLL